MNNTLFVGIDISKRSNVATFMNCEGKVVGRLTFSNNGSGADRLVAKILSYYEKEDFEAIRIGLENTSVYSKNQPPGLFDRCAIRLSRAILVREGAEQHEAIVETPRCSKHDAAPLGGVAGMSGHCRVPAEREDENSASGEPLDQHISPASPPSRRCFVSPPLMRGLLGRRRAGLAPRPSQRQGHVDAVRIGRIALEWGAFHKTIAQIQCPRRAEAVLRAGL